MEFDQVLKKATLIKRYKRFLADVMLEDGSETTIHVANTGAMTGCAQPGDTVWYSTSPNKKRKYPFSWELTETKSGDFICVNTLQANRVAIEAIKLGLIESLVGYEHCQSEVKYGEENSRIDILLSGETQKNCFIEVKSVTLVKDQSKGYFPDAVSLRGQKHLRELMTVVANGQRAVLLFVVLHSAIKSVSAASFIDPVYAELLAEAVNKGVEVIAWTSEMSATKIIINKELPVLF